MQTLYKCEKCGYMFETFSEALEHEEKHINPQYICEATDWPYQAGAKNFDYPHLITVQMADNKKAVYTLCVEETSERQREEALGKDE